MDMTLEQALAEIKRLNNEVARLNTQLTDRVAIITTHPDGEVTWEIHQPQVSIIAHGSATHVASARTACVRWGFHRLETYKDGKLHSIYRQKWSPE